MRSPTAASLALKAALLSSSGGSASAYQFYPWGFQSGSFAPLTTSSDPHRAAAQSEMINDDSYAAAMYHDPTHNLVFVTGSTYGTYFDSSPEELDRDVTGAMGMSDLEGGRDVRHAHLPKSDCFLGILKLKFDGSEVSDGTVQGMGNPAPWLAHDADGESSNQPKLIYARRFGTPQNAEACSSVLMLPQVHDALLRSPAQLKLALLGHVTPTPLSASEAASSVALPAGASNADTDRGGFLHSLSGSPEEVETNEGRAYGFVADFDVSLTADKTFTQAPDDTSFHNAYGALLGGAVLDGSALVYPVAMAQNTRDRNQLYVVSMHSENGAAVPNPDYLTTAREELDGTIHERADATLGGAGGDGARLVGGAPPYGSDFYVKVQQLSVVPSQELMNVEPTPDEQVKRTMATGWGFGFKLNDADDVRPSAVAFVQGRTPDEDLLLLGGTTRKDGERDAFITKLLVPAPSPVADMTTGHTVEEAIEDESVHPTKRIDSTTDRDETVTAICLPPPDLRSGVVTHVYVVGSSSSGSGQNPSMAYILKLRLDDLSIEWKQHIPSIHPDGIGGDVLGEGCAVSPGGTTVYVGGTIDGGSALNAGADATVHPVGGKTDVFVVAYTSDFGHVKWARQLGTVAEDKLARGGGVSTDDRGNVILMGSTRGGLQRYREDVTKVLPEEGGQAHMASDVFVMSLSRLNGEYVNAPYTGDGNAPPVSASGGVAEPLLLDKEAEEALETYEGGVGLSPGAIAGVAFVAIAVSAALLFLVARSLKARKRRLRATEPGDILRLWENEGGDDFSFSGRRILGGRRTSAMVPPIKGASSSDWDDTEGLGGSISRNASWMRSGGDDGSVHSAGSGKSSSSPKSASSPKSYTSDQTEKNLDFISTLRQEANASISKMIHKGDDDDGATDDPRVDSGNSIKSLLTHYREKKKGGLVEEEGSPGTGKRKGTKSPPPPPPRKKKDGGAAQDSEGDGLSEFTIV